MILLKLQNSPKIDKLLQVKNSVKLKKVNIKYKLMKSTLYIFLNIFTVPNYGIDKLFDALLVGIVIIIIVSICAFSFRFFCFDITNEMVAASLSLLIRENMR